MNLLTTDFMKILFLFLTALSFNIHAHEYKQIPELWSDFRDLNMSENQSSIEIFHKMSEFDLSNLTKNQYGVYGNINNSQVVLKCIEISSSKSKVLVAVAGLDRKTVESTRNTIIRLF